MGWYLPTEYVDKLWTMDDVVGLVSALLHMAGCPGTWVVARAPLRLRYEDNE